jgi:hypothetical protein
MMLVHLGFADWLGLLTRTLGIFYLVFKGHQALLK